MTTIGVPRETKDSEYRVSITPGGVRQLTLAGHKVLVEESAGSGSGFTDEQYATANAEIVSSAANAWRTELVVKVKEPTPSEYTFMRPGMVLFTYLHLAANETLTREMMARKATGIAYETVELPNGHLPLLTPMSEVAGRMAIQIGAQYMEKMNGGRGKLLGGVAGVRPADVVIIGGGVVGKNAAKIALGMGAQVFVVDINIDQLRHMEDIFGGRLTTLSSNPITIAEAVRRADLLVGAVLVKGAKAPKLVTREMINTMAPGSVVIDVAVDQGGCVETTHPTTHSHPTFLVDGVVHYCVANMPGAVPRTSTYALSNATLPYVVALANKGFTRAIHEDAALAKGLNTGQDRVTCPGVAQAFDLPLASLVDVLH
jgi:alanine dehydrogenase